MNAALKPFIALRKAGDGPGPPLRAMPMKLTTGCLRVLLPLAGCLLAAPVSGAQAQVTPVPGLTSGADSIVQGPDGALWATLSASPGRVARISVEGAITYPGVGGFSGFPANSAPSGLSASGQTFWFLLNRDRFAGMTTSGQTTPYSLDYGRPTSLVGGPDGALWMTVDSENGRTDSIVRFRPTPPAQTRFSDGLNRRSEPDSMTVGPDGALWFVDHGAARLGRITTAGALSYTPVDDDPTALAPGPLNSLWYARGTTVRRLGGDGTTYTTAAVVNALANGPDGALWAAVDGGFARIEPGHQGTFLEVAGDGRAITAGPDGRMWMTLDRAPYLVKITPPPRVDDGSIVARPGGTLSATIDPHGFVTTATVEELQNGAWRAVTSQNIGTTPTTVSFDLRDLLAPGQHSVRLNLKSDGGTVVSVPVTITIPVAPEPTPTPATPGAQLTPTPTTTPRAQAEEGEIVEVNVISGTVAYRLPGERSYTEITGSQVLPLGVVLDTTDGKVGLTTAFKGKPQQGIFYGGKFNVTQTRTGITELALAGPLACGKPKATASARPRAAKKKKRIVWGKDSGGSYRTRGTSSVATVRGTEWRTEDTCAGTTI